MQSEDSRQSTVNGRFLKSCNAPLEELKIAPFVMVIFGGSGDLSQRMVLPALYHLSQEERLIKDFSILGFGLPEFSDQEYRNFIKESMKKFAHGAFNDNDWDKFSSHLFYQSADFKIDENYKMLCERIAEIDFNNAQRTKEVIFYMAVPPALTPLIIEKLTVHNLCRGQFNTKLIHEKPFGRDRRSAYKLNQSILKAFDERQIYRIDHYLGKDTVQSIIFFRFANSILEPLWNRRYIDHIQITVAESLGIGHRGIFYEQAGVIRDIVQNHIMQLIALVAMEPPVGFEADLIRDEKIKVFKTIRGMEENDIERFTAWGQYGRGKIAGQDVIGYREEEKVSPDSEMPTFFAGKFYIDNWRWAGVPFYVRTGKRLAERVTEIYLQFKQPPLRLFGRTCDVLEPNSITFSIQPQERIVLSLGVKYPGIGNEPYRVDLDFNYETTFNTKHLAYERLLIDCIRGDLTLFARQDGVEAMWSVVDPIIRYREKNSPHGFPNYASGSWGPEESEKLIGKDGRKWHLLG